MIPFLRMHYQKQRHYGDLAVIATIQSAGLEWLRSIRTKSLFISEQTPLFLAVFTIQAAITAFFCAEIIKNQLMIRAMTFISCFSTANDYLGQKGREYDVS